jgi:hypothetical protein
MTKSKGIQAPRAVWTDDQLDMLRLFFPKHKTADVATMIGYTESAVNGMAKRMGIRKTAEYLASPAACRLRKGDQVGKAYRFEKGHSTWNKGSKGVHTGGEETQFKAGQRPVNTLPIGSTKFDKSGTLLRKVSDAAGNNSKRWRGVHELVWIEANGPLPPKHIVRFKQGMRTNVLEEITIDRVECVSLAENMRRNTVHNMPKELVDVVRIRAVLTRHINRRTKNESEKDN